MAKDMKTAIASDLAACKAAFEQINIPWVIQGGAVLGYGRYKDIMAWDTDLDMAVFAEVTAAQRKIIFNSMRKHGFGIAERGKDFIMGNREVTLNLWFFHKKGDFYEAFPATTPGYKFIEKAMWYDEPQMVEFLNSEYPMPNHLDDFLEAHYGSDWKTNIIKNHGTYFKEKRGIRNNIPDWYSNRRRKSDGQLWWPAILKLNENIEDLLP